MGVQRPRHPQAETPRQRLMADREPWRIDDCRCSVPEVDHVRRMAEALIDEIVDPHCPILSDSRVPVIQRLA